MDDIFIALQMYIKLITGINLRLEILNGAYQIYDVSGNEYYILFEIHIKDGTCRVYNFRGYGCLDTISYENLQDYLLEKIEKIYIRRKA